MAATLFYIVLFLKFIGMEMDRHCCGSLCFLHSGEVRVLCPTVHLLPALASKPLPMVLGLPKPWPWVVLGEHVEVLGDRLADLLQGQGEQLEDGDHHAGCEMCSMCGAWRWVACGLWCQGGSVRGRLANTHRYMGHTFEQTKSTTE